MSRELSMNETHNLSHSMEQMYVNTPVAKSSKNGALKLKGTYLDSEDYNTPPLSPPPTVDTRQKRERSESLMLYYKTETTTTKRRLRSRSRIGFEFDEEGSSMMTPCTSKPKERIHKETMPYYCKAKHLETPKSSVFLTPCSAEPMRMPLQNRDLNSSNLHLDSDSELLDDHYDYSTDSSSDGELKTKLTFEEEEEQEYKTPVSEAWGFGKLIGRRMGEKKVDFIQELIDLNCEEICKKIFCYLEPENLQRVASVSKLWRRVCKKDRIASPRLDQFIHGRKQYVLKKGKENLGHHTKFQHKVSHRQPLSVKSNTLWTPELEASSRDKETLDKIKCNMLSAYEKVKCPACGSPSRKLSDEDVCECEKCHEKFCHSCQHRIDVYHKTGKCAIKLKSKKGKNKEVIGSKHSKSRLKRF